MLMIHIPVSPSQGVSEGRIQKGIPPLGKARGTLEYSHTGTFFMPSLPSQTETQRQTDSEFQIWNKPILEVLTNWKTTKNGAYQQWWQLKLLIGLQGGCFSGLNEMNTAPHWTPIGSALLVPTVFIACYLSGQPAFRSPCGRAGRMHCPNL